MRIAVVHSYYSARQPSGENIVVDAQVEALRTGGHDVLLVAERTDERAARRGYALEAAWTVATGKGRSPLPALLDFHPDVVHVHNLFPNFGTEWLTEWPGPIVATMHNYRPLCAAGTLFRDGGHCTLCPDGNRWAGVRHACYRSSRIATVPLAWSNRHGPTGDPILSRADGIVFLTPQAEQTYGKHGITSSHTRVIPNFVADRTVPAHEPASRWLYAGRLSAEKGVVRMVDGWPRGHQLDVFGDGPLLEGISSRGEEGAGVSIEGPIQHDDLLARMPEYDGLVVPSMCREGLPTVALEALAVGLPIIAGSESTVAQLVTQFGVGRVLAPDEWVPDRVGAALMSIESEGETLRSHCIAVQRERFGAGRWLTSIEQLYKVAQQRRP